MRKKWASRDDESRGLLNVAVRKCLERIGSVKLWCASHVECLIRVQKCFLINLSVRNYLCLTNVFFFTCVQTMMKYSAKKTRAMDLILLRSFLLVWAIITIEVQTKIQVKF